MCINPNQKFTTQHFLFFFKVVSYCLGAVEVWNMFAGLEVIYLIFNNFIRYL